MVRQGLVLFLLAALLAACGGCESPDATVTPVPPKAAATASHVSETPSRTATSTAALPPPSPTATAEATSTPTALPTPTTELSLTATAQATRAPTVLPTPTSEPSPTSTATAEQRPVPAVSANPAPTRLSAGYWHACALGRDHITHCWGSSKSGRASPPTGERFTSLAAGEAHTCGLRADGSVVCWGHDAHGQASAPEHEQFVSIGAGTFHACGLRADGSAICWGDDTKGQASPPEDERFVSLSVGSTYTCGLRGDGSAFCWGAGGQGLPPAGERLIALATSYHGCGLIETGDAVCWGSNYWGQASAPAGERFIALAAGSFHSCGLRADGSAICWGQDNKGQASPPTGERFTSLAGGADYTCGQRSDSSVVCWGSDTLGQASPPFLAFTDLPLGEPRYQPAGYALFSSLRGCFWHCDAGSVGVLRTVFSERGDELLVDDPLAPLDDLGYFVSFDVSESGRLMAASLCVVGDCGGIDAPSDDAAQEIWVSRDGGSTWESWGATGPSSWLLRVTDDDVAVRERADATSEDSAVQVRWIRSGTVFPAPGAGAPDWPSGWDGDAPVWGEHEVPPAPPALSELTDWAWTPIQSRPDGSTVWSASEYGRPLLLLAVVNAEGAVGDVYGWRSADYVSALVEMGDALFVGFSIQGAHDGLATAHLPFVIDLTTESVHPLLGLPSGGPWPEPWRAIPLGRE